MQSIKLLAVVALASVAALVAVSQVEAINAKQLLALITSLESPSSKFSPTERNKIKRENDLRTLIQETSPDILANYHREAIKNAQDMQKGFSHMTYETKQGNIFATISKNVGKTFLLMGKNFDPEIEDATNLVDLSLQNTKDIPEEQVHCLVQNFLLKHLTNIIFILRTNLKYLITEDTALINDAIIQKLRSNRWEAQTDFYQGHQFNLAQAAILHKFYQENQDVGRESVGDAIDHINLAGEQIVGRVLESCSAVLQYKSTRDSIASSTKGCVFDRQSVFGAKTLSQEAIDETLLLCENLLNSHGK